jgi:hypothetical protein
LAQTPPVFLLRVKIEVDGPPSVGNVVDSNIKALLHVQSALLAALCATHPNPDALNEAFSFHLEQVNAVLETSMTTALVTAWANTFRQHIPRPSTDPPA